VAAASPKIPTGGVSTIVSASICDANGKVITTSTAPITFTLTGAGTIQGLNPARAFRGVATITYVSGTVESTATVSAVSPGLAQGSAIIIVSNHYPALAVDATQLNFGSINPGQALSSWFTVTSTGNAVLNGTITADQPWIKVSPETFSLDYTPGANSLTVSVTVDNTILQQKSGQFTGKITVDTDAGSAQLAVSVSATCVLVKPNPIRLTSTSLSTGRSGQAPKLTFFGSGIVPGETTINIYTLSGELVTSLNSTPSPLMGRGQGEGLSNEINWNGNNASGDLITPGIYIYTYASPLEKGVGKFTVVK
jgi:hypothetical protein